MPVLASYWLAVVITAVAKCAAATARLLLPLLLLSWGGRALFAGLRHTRSQLVSSLVHACNTKVWDGYVQESEFYGSGAGHQNHPPSSAHRVIRDKNAFAQVNTYPTTSGEYPNERDSSNTSAAAKTASGPTVVAENLYMHGVSESL